MKVRLPLLIVTALAGLALTTIGTASPQEPLDCKSKAFPWGGQCRSASEGQDFATWLEKHGVEPLRFAKRHPDLSSVFRGQWPPAPARWSDEWLRERINAAWPQEDEWDRISICETGGNWRHSNSSYQGGVGFATSSWDGWRPSRFPAEAWQATRLQQMYVAERIFDDYGLSGWGCRGAA